MITRHEHGENRITKKSAVTYHQVTERVKLNGKTIQIVNINSGHINIDTHNLILECNIPEKVNSTYTQ